MVLHERCKIKPPAIDAPIVLVAWHMLLFALLVHR
jgi:hypothetical protein